MILRKFHPYGCTDVDVAVQRDIRTMNLADMFYNRQTKTGTPGLSAAAFVHAKKTFKHAFLVFG